MSSYQMIDVGPKEPTLRKCIAQGKLWTNLETLKKVAKNELPKGDALKMAEIAGIQGAKRAWDLLPLCHPLPIEKVGLSCSVQKDHILVECQVLAHAKTGVEMEALAGVQVALLCLYDLIKMVDPEIILGSVALVQKSGGKSGNYTSRFKNFLEFDNGPAKCFEEGADAKPSKPENPLTLREALNAAVLTVSDRCWQGVYQDHSGPVLVQEIKKYDFNVKTQAVVPDQIDLIQMRIKEWAGSVDLILLTGGTGVSPRDLSPEALLGLEGMRQIPGIGEWLRSSGAKFTAHAWLSRSIAVVYKNTLLVALPGSPKACKEGLEAIGQVLGHLCAVAKGQNHG